MNRTIIIDKLLVPRFTNETMTKKKLKFEMKDLYGNIVEYIIRFDLTIPLNSKPYFKEELIHTQNVTVYKN